jgi:hypothetical protein
MKRILGSRQHFTGDATMAADVLTAEYRSFAMLTPMTAIGHRWVEEHVQIEPWQEFGASIACDPRCLGPLVAAMREDGLVVEPE